MKDEETDGDCPSFLPMEQSYLRRRRNMWCRCASFPEEQEKLEKDASDEKKAHDGSKQSFEQS